jgi:serine/threonine-protein kinase
MRAFEGETVSDNLALILRGEPDWTRLPSNTPSILRSLIRRCLQRDPRKRLHDIADARIEIEEIGIQPAEEAIIKKRFPLSWIVGFVAAGILLGFMIGLIVSKTGRGKLSPSTTAAVIKIEPGHSLAGERGDLGWPTRTAMAISTDERFIVYCAVNNGAESDRKPQLFLRELGKLDVEPIPGTEGGIAPFLSPDDRWIGFFADGMLKKVSVEGGVPQDLCEADLPFGASWGDDDTIVFNGIEAISGLLRVPIQGGKPELLTENIREQGEYSHRLPHHLPNGKGVLFTIMKSSFDIEPRVAILESDTGKWRELLEDAADARYIPTGHLVFLRRGTFMAVAFDLKRLRVSGQPVAVIDGVMQALNSSYSVTETAAGQFSVSDSGSLAYAPGGIFPNWQNMLVWVDAKGNEKPVSSKVGAYSFLRLSPDGQNIVYSTMGTERHLWIYDIGRDIHKRVVSEGMAGRPIWTPDGKRIVFTWRGPDQSRNTYVVPADGSTDMEPLLGSKTTPSASSFSPDGNLLAFVVPSGSWDIHIYDFRDKSSTPFATAEHSETHPEFSPDGRWIAYRTDRDGRNEVYVRPSSGIGKTIRISREGGSAPFWARSGKKIFYTWWAPGGELQMWAVNIQIAPSFSVGPPRLLFKKRGLAHSTPVRLFDISSDDQRFLMVRLEERKPRPVTEMILIRNWFEDLKRIVPTGK